MVAETVTAASIAHANTNDLDPWFMPFTANRSFKKAPRLLVSAEGMYYTAKDGRQILDASAGLWCVNAGHGRKKIVEAVQAQVATMDFAPTFQMGHPAAFELASRVAALAPEGLESVFFANSGSEAVDTALKIALAYHRARGEGQRVRFVGRERGYHGIGFGGISVGGISANRKMFGAMLPYVDHLPHTHNLKEMAFSQGQPDWGAHLADDLERICALHDPSTIAAVIVEPVAGSTGVLVPPKGYLERLRAITEKHGILLIFDEVITGFGRLGKAFASEYFGITPDMMTIAKGLTNATVPASGVVLKREIYDAMMQGPEWAVEFAHGYTYSAHPLAVAAGLATLDVYKEEDLFNRGNDLVPVLQDAVHSLKGEPHVIDIRNIGLMAAVELAPAEGAPGKRGYDAFLKAYEAGVYIRLAGDVLAFSPPLIAEPSHIEVMVETLRKVLRTLD
ncbi:MAG: aspartate aminotransferase family protein [Alphaproteobacteria bacterium]|nr:aspartate aminotransferase family protein [Alphaproteobacteria bacterium]MCB9930536.1 aspartate aminotransferase family protein [Alphaproteobacteria bacterium]